jgi:hypothetical protein
MESLQQRLLQKQPKGERTSCKTMQLVIVYAKDQILLN